MNGEMLRQLRRVWVIPYKNARTLGVNGSFNFVSLYNKVPFLKKVNRPAPRKRPTKDVEDEDEKVNKKKEGMSSGTKALFKFLMMVKQAQVGINLTDGTTLPGFTKEINAIGQNFANNTPGLPFIFGAQDEDFRKKIAANGFFNYGCKPDSEIYKSQWIRYQRIGDSRAIQRFQSEFKIQ